MADPIICSPIICVHFLCLRSLSSKVLIHTSVGTDKSRGFDTQVQLPMMHLPPCKCQDVAAERLPPLTAGIIILPSAKPVCKVGWRVGGRVLASVTETDP